MARRGHVSDRVTVSGCCRDWCGIDVDCNNHECVAAVADIDESDCCAVAVADGWPVFVVAESTICGLCGDVMWLRVGKRFLVGTGVPVIGVWCAEWADYSDRGAAHG